MKKYKFMHMQLMGGFNWFKIIGWNILRRLWATRQVGKLIQAVVDHHYLDSSGILWLCSGKRYHRNLNNKIPWERVKRKGRLTFDFSKPSKKFYKLWRLWLKECKKRHFKFRPILMMKEEYCAYPFENNINGISGINSPEAWPVIRDYMRRVVEIYVEIFGKFPKIIPWNEPDHRGSGKAYHKIMYDHEAVRDEVVIPGGGEYTDIWPDITSCEGGPAELIELHGNCPKPGDCDRNGWHGKDGQHRRKGGLMSIKHDVSTLADVLERMGNMVGSGNAQRMFTEDGGGRHGDGRYRAGPFKIPCGDADQQYEMMCELIRVDQEEGFFAPFGTFLHECLTVKMRLVSDCHKAKLEKRGTICSKCGYPCRAIEEIDLFIPNYRKSMVNWARIRGGVLRACKEMLGE